MCLLIGRGTEEEVIWCNQTILLDPKKEKKYGYVESIVNILVEVPDGLEKAELFFLHGGMIQDLTNESHKFLVKNDWVNTTLFNNMAIPNRALQWHEDTKTFTVQTADRSKLHGLLQRVRLGEIGDHILSYLIPYNEAKKADEELQRNGASLPFSGFKVKLSVEKPGYQLYRFSFRTNSGVDYREGENVWWCAIEGPDMAVQKFNQEVKRLTNSNGISKKLEDILGKIEKVGQRYDVLFMGQPKDFRTSFIPLDQPELMPAQRGQCATPWPYLMSDPVVGTIYWFQPGDNLNFKATFNLTEKK